MIFKGSFILGPDHLSLTGFRVESGWGIYGCAESGAILFNSDWFSC